MKAVVEIGGKQYLVEPGTIFLADKLPKEKGESYTSDRVLMILDGDDVVLGKPYIEDGKVTFSVLDQTKRKKIVVQKYRAKKGYLRTRGHRQHVTQVQVELIEGGGKRDERVIEKKAKKKKAAPKVESEKKEKASEPTAKKKTTTKKETTKKTPAKKTATKKTTTKKTTTKKTTTKKKTKKEESED